MYKLFILQVSIIPTTPTYFTAVPVCTLQVFGFIVNVCRQQQHLFTTRMSILSPVLEIEVALILQGYVKMFHETQKKRRHYV